MILKELRIRNWALQYENLFNEQMHMTEKLKQVTGNIEMCELEIKDELKDMTSDEQDILKKLVPIIKEFS